MAATFFDTLFDQSAAPVLASVLGDGADAWAVEGERVTAYQLKTGQSFSAILHQYESEPAQDGNVGNVLKVRLWVPLNVRPQPQDQWRIIRADSSQDEFTVTDYGAISGGYQEIKLVKTTITRFKSAGKLT